LPYESYLSELTALRDLLKAGLSGAAPEQGAGAPPTVAELAERIMSLNAAHTIEAALQGTGKCRSQGEEPVTTQIRRREQEAEGQWHWRVSQREERKAAIWESQRPLESRGEIERLMPGSVRGRRIGSLRRRSIRNPLAQNRPAGARPVVVASERRPDQFWRPQDGRQDSMLRLPEHDVAHVASGSTVRAWPLPRAARTVLRNLLMSRAIIS
jgi:hypothetical protein